MWRERKARDSNINKRKIIYYERARPEGMEKRKEMFMEGEEGEVREQQYSFRST